MRKPLLASAIALLLPASVGQAASVTWWNWDPDATRADFAPAIAAFTRDTGIDVHIEHVDWSAFPETLRAALADGKAPDVVSVSSAWFPSLAAEGAFADLMPLISATKGYDFNDIFAASYQLWQYDLRQYAMPLDNDVAALFYNKTLLASAGLVEPGNAFDWGGLLTDVQKLTRDQNGDGRFDQYGYSSYWSDWIPFVWAAGGQLFDHAGNLTLNTPQAAAALSFYAQLYPAQTHGLITNTDAAKLGYKSPADAWSAGVVGFAPAGSWMPEYWIYDAAKAKYRFDFDVANMPLSPTGKRATTIGGQGVAILAASAHPDLAWRLLQYLADTNYQKLAAEHGQFPVRRSVAVSAAFLQPDRPPKHKATFIGAAAEYARPLPAFSWWPKAYAALNGQLARYFGGNTALADAVAAAGEQIDALRRPAN
ncbi:MAG TPA: sugar ABC transporter substrate-binding protein [Limnochordia bacterium]|nr:sugar ABC transporter substrate-binding protein [Limnochordia bacterium]